MYCACQPALVACFCVLSAMSGCMEPQTTPAKPPRIDAGGYRTQQLNTQDYNAAFAAAQGAVMDHFQIASADALTGVIQLVPSEHARLGGARIRRTGTVVIRNTGSFILAGVRVSIERYATPSIRAIQPNFGYADEPGRTPIQGEGALTPQQQEYWTPEGRDLSLEAQILNGIVSAIEQTNRGAASEPGTADKETRRGGDKEQQQRQ